MLILYHEFLVHSLAFADTKQKVNILSKPLLTICSENIKMPKKKVYALCFCKHDAKLCFQFHVK